jgi:hypothetical protein
MYRFLIVIEKTNGNHSAYSADLPGCVATGETREEVKKQYLKLYKKKPRDTWRAIRLLHQEGINMILPLSTI